MEYLAEFGGTYLKDTYFLGVTVEGANLRFKMLFALTTDHPEYAPPLPGEQHCYREGSILIDQPSILNWEALNPVVMIDASGAFDFGSIELYRIRDGEFRIVTEWFETSVASTRLSIELSGGR